MTKLKPLIDFNFRTDPKLVLSRGNAVYTGLKDNPAYPTPPVDLGALQTTLDDLSRGIAGAMDGGKKAFAERDHTKAIAVKMLRLLASYVEAHCNDDVNILLSSGFAAASTARMHVDPLSQFIRSIGPTSIGGQLLVTLVSMAAAFSYELRWALAARPGEAQAPWTVVPVVKVRPPVLITGLTPGATYVFQVRALTAEGYTEWSDSVSRMAV